MEYFLVSQLMNARRNLIKIITIATELFTTIAELSQQKYTEYQNIVERIMRHHQPL